jgi:hypothetical protein
MTRRLMVMLFLVVCATGFVGCAADAELDSLWRQGYGFNNPNADRMRQGKPSVGLDGR